MKKKMPKANFTSITVSDRIYDAIKQRIINANKEAGYKKFRSVAHYIEWLVMEANDVTPQNDGK